MSSILKGLQLNELSNKKLGDYKTAAGADATAADKEGNYKRGDKRMSGIIKATKKQFANDERKKDVTETGIPFRGVGGAFNRGDDERHDLDVPKQVRPQVWGLKINGKIWSKGGKSVTFNSKDAALNIRNSILKNRPDLEIGLITKGGQQGMAEEWSQKYKKSINCSHPKGFSQKAHCAGKKKHNESIDNIMEMTCPDCGMCQTHGDHSHDNLEEACWKGYHKEGNKKMFGKTYPNCVKNKKSNEDIEEDNSRVARKPGQPANSKKHSDLYTDENPKGTITGLKFASEEDARASVSKIRNSGRSHAHKIQAAVAMEQRARAAGKASAANVYRSYINSVKKTNEEDVTEEKKPDFMKAGNMKPFNVSGKEIPGAVHTLEKALLKAKERNIKLNYTNIDKIMQAVCKKHHLTGDELHNEFVEKHHMIPDNWIVKQLDEACWDTHKQVGMKNKGGKQVPNCVPKESVSEQSNYDWPAEKEKIRTMSTTQRREYALARLAQTNDDKYAHIASKAGAGHSEIMNAINKGSQGVAEGQHSCPHCGNEMVSEELMNEKKDACYYKVKSRYKVWPSAYASGALVKCRNKGASNWGNGGKKNESSILEGINRADESLHDWFNKEKWVRMDTKGKIKGPCAREPGEGKPKCLPQSKAHSLGKKGRASAAQRKRREDPNPERSGKAINVNTKKKSNENVEEGWKQKLGAAALTGAMALGAGAAHGRVTYDADGNQVGGMKPTATQQATDSAPAATPSTATIPGQGLVRAERADRQAGTVIVNGQEYKMIMLEPGGIRPRGGQQIVIPQAVMGERGIGNYIAILVGSRVFVLPRNE